MMLFLQQFSRTVTALLVLLVLAEMVSAQVPGDSLRCGGDSLRLIPCGPMVGTFDSLARVTVADTVAGWAKIYVEGWVPVQSALPYLNVVRIDSTAVRASLGLLDGGKAKKAAEQKQCEAVTRSGKRCSRKAEKGTKFCWQHQNR